MELKELSPAARAVVQSKLITGDWEYAAFAALLQQVAAFDAVADKRTKFRLGAMVLCIVTAFIGTIVGVILIDEELELVGWTLLVLGLASIAGAIGFGVAWSRVRAMTLPENNLAALLQLFRRIYQDLHPEGTIQARIDLSGMTPAKRGPLLTLPQEGWIRREQAVYRDPWLQLRFRLRDGYTVRLRQRDEMTELKRTRRNARGKQKTKSKFTKLCRVTATLIPKEPVQFQAPGPVDAAWERVRAGTKKGRTVAVWDRWFLYKQKLEQPKQTPTGAELAGVLMRVCSVRPASEG
jgi:hypothetical protein